MKIITVNGNLESSVGGVYSELDSEWHRECRVGVESMNGNVE